MTKKLTAVAVSLLMAWQVGAQTSAQLNDMHTKLIKFYAYQRAGLSSGSANNANPGFTNASHNGDNYNGNLLDGGWYDAGDYIKFGMNLGYTVYCLLKGYDVFPSAYGSSTGVPEILKEVKFATDYMIKAVINDNTVVLDVGQASDEHGSWGVKYPSGRSGGQILLCSGGDIPATYAACLALMSTVYRKYDAPYADQCLAKAKVAFAFAKKKFDAGQNYCQAQQKHGAFLYYYPTKTGGGYMQQIGDRKVAAGVELYRATNDGDPIYRDWAKSPMTDMFNCMGYSYIGPLAAFEVWRQGLGDAAALTANVNFIEGKIQTTGTFKDIYQNSGWGTAREAGTAAFEYALGYVVTSSTDIRDRNLARVKTHVGWVGGHNGSPARSYIIGYNGSPATNIHYRTNSQGPQGGVVSGPDGSGNWSNDGTPEHCEVAIDYNAGIVGAVAFLKAIENPGDAIKINPAFTATKTSEVNFNTETVTFNVGFSKSVPWQIVITGAFGTKTYSGTGTSVNQSWDGSADNGFFLSGETVSAKLNVEGDIVAYDIMKARGFGISIISAKKPAAKSEDVLIDDFEDSNLANMKGGNWEGFGTMTGLNGTRTTFAAQDGSNALQVTGTDNDWTNTNYAGVKTTFNGAGSAGNIGDIASVLFDIKANRDLNVCVEIEQSTVTDGAYHRVVVPVKTTVNTYRLDISRFIQPEWKTTEKALDKNSITAVRFTVYDSTGRYTMFLDNVAIERFANSTVSNLTRVVKSAFNPVLRNNELVYRMPAKSADKLEVVVFDVAGRAVASRSFRTASGGVFTVALSGLPAGTYTIMNKVDGKVFGTASRFVLAK